MRTCPRPSARPFLANCNDLVAHLKAAEPLHLAEANGNLVVEVVLHKLQLKVRCQCLASRTHGKVQVRTMSRIVTCSCSETRCKVSHLRNWILRETNLHQLTIHTYMTKLKLDKEVGGVGLVT